MRTISGALGQTYRSHSKAPWNDYAGRDHTIRQLLDVYQANLGCNAFGANGEAVLARLRKAIRHALMLMEHVILSKSLPEMMPEYWASKEIALKHLMAVHLEERVMADLFALPDGCIGTVKDFLTRYPD